jgi:hypothetical protein
MTSRTPWTALVVREDGGRTPAPLGGPRQLAELYRWRDGVPSPRRLIDTVSHAPRPLEPRLIDWYGFPERDAIIAVAAEDLVGLLRRSSPT